MQRRQALKTLAAAPLAFAGLAARRAPASHYDATWDAIDRRPTPEWYTASKFGIFIHWGVYSVPAYAAGEYQGSESVRGVVLELAGGREEGDRSHGPGALTWDFHKRNYGADFPYFDFAPMFRAELFDPDHWADVIRRIRCALCGPDI